MGQKMHFKSAEKSTSVPGTDHFSKDGLWEREKAIWGLHFPAQLRYWLSTCGYHMGKESKDGIKWLKIARLKPFLFSTFEGLQIQFWEEGSWGNDVWLCHAVIRSWEKVWIKVHLLLGTIQKWRPHRGARRSKNWLILRTKSTTKVRTRRRGQIPNILRTSFMNGPLQKFPTTCTLFSSAP